MRRIVWKKQASRFQLSGAMICFEPMARRDIAEVIGFLGRNFPNLRGSFQSPYAKRAFYLRDVALAETWAKDCRQKRVFCYVARSLKSGRILGVSSVYRDGDLPTAVSGIGAIAEAFRETGLFEEMVSRMDRLLQASGVLHVICLATVDNQAAQRVYLRCGCRPCGIIPGEDLRIAKNGKLQFIPDIYFCKFYGRAGKGMLRSRQWQLVPEVAKLRRVLRNF